MNNRNCAICLVVFHPSNAQLSNGYGKFCSRLCYSKSDSVKLGGYSCRNVPKSSETKSKISFAKKGMSNGHKGMEIPNLQGEKHFAWKGRFVGYSSLHSWIRRVLGKAKQCEECGLDKIPFGKKRFFQWANISHLYKRDVSDWKELCIKCHMAFDRHGNLNG